MGEYTIGASAAVVAVVAVELLWLRTGLLRRASFWVSMAVVFAFQTLVDGWLTKLSAPIVEYRPGRYSGARFPWDIPVEDFMFGFALVTLVLLLWERGRPRRAAGGREVR